MFRKMESKGRRNIRMHNKSNFNYKEFSYLFSAAKTADAAQHLELNINLWLCLPTIDFEKEEDVTANMATSVITAIK